MGGTTGGGNCSTSLVQSVAQKVAAQAAIQCISSRGGKNAF